MGRHLTAELVWKRGPRGRPRPGNPDPVAAACLMATGGCLLIALCLWLTGAS